MNQNINYKHQIEQKEWFKIKENREKFDKAMKNVPKEIRIRIGGIGGNAFAKKIKNNPEFRKKVGEKISKANKGHIVTDKTRDKIRKKTLNQFKDGMPENTKKKLREIRIKQIMKVCGFTDYSWAQLEKYETEIINHLEKIHSIKFKRSYYCDGYFIDGYNEKYKIAVEIDEKHHKKPKQKEKDIKRQKYIENKLNCHFIRIPSELINFIRGGCNV